MFELKNGASIEYLTLKRDAGANGGWAGYVLARKARSPRIERDGYEWVVWTVDGEGNCYNGGYHGNDIHAALDEYRERSAGAR